MFLSFSFSRSLFFRLRSVRSPDCGQYSNRDFFPRSLSLARPLFSPFAPFLRSRFFWLERCGHSVGRRKPRGEEGEKRGRERIRAPTNPQLSLFFLKSVVRAHRCPTYLYTWCARECVFVYVSVGFGECVRVGWDFLSFVRASCGYVWWRTGARADVHERPIYKILVNTWTFRGGKKICTKNPFTNTRGINCNGALSPEYWFTRKS